MKKKWIEYDSKVLNQARFVTRTWIIMVCSSVLCISPRVRVGMCFCPWITWTTSTTISSSTCGYYNHITIVRNALDQSNNHTSSTWCSMLSSFACITIISEIVTENVWTDWNIENNNDYLLVLHWCSDCRKLLESMPSQTSIAIPSQYHACARWLHHLFHHWHRFKMNISSGKEKIHSI